MGHALSSFSDSQKTPASTPQRTTNAPICVDPRSPSQDIERTPIQLNNTGNNKASESSENSAKTNEKPQKQSLRQKMFARMKNNSTEIPKDE